MFLFKLYFSLSMIESFVQLQQTRQKCAVQEFARFQQIYLSEEGWRGRQVNRYWHTENDRNKLKNNVLMTAELSASTYLLFRDTLLSHRSLSPRLNISVDCTDGLCNTFVNVCLVRRKIKDSQTFVGLQMSFAGRFLIMGALKHSNLQKNVTLLFCLPRLTLV